MTGKIDAVEVVAELMALSALTAPKARGSDPLVVRTMTGADLERLAEEMRRLGEAYGLEFFVRDAGCVEQSDACLFIGARGESVAGLDCGGCGCARCEDMLEAQRRLSDGEMPFCGPNCVIRMADLGIALGSAVKTASIHNVDNRIMYTAGVGALSLGWMEGCNVAYGIPLRASCKNIYFDRTG